ncbi:MAG TPA: hypothetical protein VL501_05370 [Pyrinomonadaceae bacterium]|nr:hypothetical protein [Pyrinomonadaceae bacterium]
MQAKALVAAWGVLILFVALLVLGHSIGPTVTSAEEIEPMPTPKQDLTSRQRFYKHLPKDFELPSDETGQLLLREYGALFVAREGAVPPRKVIFRDDADVLRFQGSVEVGSKVLGGRTVELQRAAMESLAEAIDEARKARLSITPRGADSARRSYDDTRRLWASRVKPGLKYWVAKGRVSPAEAKRIEALSPFEQVAEILRLEQSGIYFAKSLDKSIIYSVAPPGTSQHLSMLAFDVAEFDNARVRAILAKHGWFQTVSSDLPHFTYLGVSEKDLPGLGLKETADKTGRIFWVPDL